MGDVDTLPTFGADLKDGFKPANVWVSHGIAWLDDIQQFYRERSVIEKEYSSRLNALAKRYFEKKSKKTAPLSVGDTPSMTPGSLESASLTTWTTQLTTLEKLAEEHEKYGNELVTKVAEPLKTLNTRLDEVRKRHADYAEKMEKERDAVYADLRKTKGKYDAVCQEVESKRKKSESAFDKAKAQSTYQQQILEMNNTKNSYLIAINVTNKQKEMYYHEYVPEVMDSLQDLAEFRTAKLNGFWTMATQLENSLMKQGHQLMDNLTHEISRNEPQLDSMMYIQHNMGSWQEPADKKFEPSPVWHDDDGMVVDDIAKVYLRNVLNKSKSQLGDLRREVDKKRRDVESMKRNKQRLRETSANNGTSSSGGGGSDLDKDEIELVKQLFTLQEEMHQVDRKRVTAEVETSTITSAVGDVTLGAKNHNFKSQTFKIPTNCDLCGERIWGLSAKGFDCRDCGYTCHNKCEMKVPAECPGELSKEERKKLKAERQEAANALLKPRENLPEHVSELPSLSRSNTTRSSSNHRPVSIAVTHPATAELADTSNGGGNGIAAATTESGDDDEEDINTSRSSSSRPKSMAVPSSSATAGGGGGARKRLMAPPPTSYLGEQGDLSNGLKRPTEQKGKMVYGFEASGAGELTVPEGRDVVLLEADDGSGWIKIRAGYKEGLVPASYVELAPLVAITPPPPPTMMISAQHTGQSGRPESMYSTHSTSSVNTTTGGVKKRGPAVAPKRGAKKLRYVEALYEYSAQNDTEHSMAVGERFVLIKEDPGDGWIEVEKGGQTRSVPANYVQTV